MTAVESGVPVICKCGHSLLRHNDVDMESDDMCGAIGCDCEEFIPTGVEERLRALTTTPETRPPGPRPAVPAPTGTIATAAGLLVNAQQSHSKRTRSLGERIGALLQELTERLNEEESSSAARREVAELEAKLAAAKAKLRGEPTTQSGPRTGRGYNITYGQFPCPDCDKISTTAQGRASHRRISHGYRKPVES
jgi:hypothetical protein